MRSLCLPACIVALFIFTPASYAVDEPSEMLSNPLQEQRAEAIGAQLRCLVCQNESIEESAAPLAHDLRVLVRRHIAAGETDKQIFSWMTTRYGTFIRFAPPFRPGTFMLWAMPAIAFIFGVGIIIRYYQTKTSDYDAAHEDNPPQKRPISQRSTGDR